MERITVIEKEFSPIVMHPQGYGYYIQWDYQPAYENGVKQAHGTCYSIHCPYRKPTLNLVKYLVKMTYNQITDMNILTGFKWNNKEVYLSAQNQTNYKAAYDLAVQTQGGNLPYTIKIGNDDEEEYVTFSTVEEFSDFYLAMNRHINDCIKSGWDSKDNMDWDKFVVPLKNVKDLPIELDILTNTL